MQNALKNVCNAIGIRDQLEPLLPGDGFSAGITWAMGAALYLPLSSLIPPNSPIIKGVSHD